MGSSNSSSYTTSNETTSSACTNCSTTTSTDSSSTYTTSSNSPSTNTSSSNSSSSNSFKSSHTPADLTDSNLEVQPGEGTEENIRHGRQRPQLCVGSPDSQQPVQSVSKLPVSPSLQ